MTLNNWWSKNSQREKILVMITIPLLVLILVQLVVLQPLEQKQKEYSKKIQSNGVELEQMTQQIEATQKILAVSSKIKLDKQKESLQKQIIEQKKLLSELTDNLIPPEEMALVVEKLLKQRGKLKLLSLVNMESEGLPDDEEDSVSKQPSINPENKTAEANVQPLIYRHPLEIKFSGSYFQVMEYLKVLENSEQNFYWEKLDYKVNKYPQAEVLLKLSTLGTEPQWMGASSNDE